MTEEGEPFAADLLRETVVQPGWGRPLEQLGDRAGGQVGPLGLAELEHVDHAEAAEPRSRRARRGVRRLCGVAVCRLTRPGGGAGNVGAGHQMSCAAAVGGASAREGGEDCDAVLAAADLPSQLLPGAEAGYRAGVRALAGDEQDVAGELRRIASDA